MSDELRRSDDQMIGKLIQALEDDRRSSKEWRDRHDQESREWRLSVDQRLKPVEEWVKSANNFWKVFAAITGVGVAGIKLWAWASGHWK